MTFQQSYSILFIEKEIKMKTMMNAVVVLTVLCASTFGKTIRSNYLKEKKLSTFTFTYEY